MSTAILAARRTISRSGLNLRLDEGWPLLAAVAVLGVAIVDPAAGRIAVQAISDAYLQVSVFVAATLALFFAAERGLHIDTAAWMVAHRRWQVPVAALLGALPGCGGAVVVATQFVRGRIGFGAMVAVLTSTMGDAAFLLIAREPATAAGVIALGLVVGIVSGYAVDAWHGPEFMRQPARDEAAGAGTACTVDHRPVPLLRPWAMWLVPGAVLGVALAFQVEVDAWFGPLAAWEPSLWFGFIGGVLALAMWVRGRGEEGGCDCRREEGLLAKVAADTNFVTAWVVAAYLVFELGLHFSGADLAALFRVWGPVMPLMGVAVGLIPGCGPQIVVTSLYLAGAVPFSAQLGNALSNDGDALFPALAIAPRAAMTATLYSAVPALVVAYGWYAFFE